jgi:hypothetical protein
MKFVRVCATQKKIRLGSNASELTIGHLEILNVQWLTPTPYFTINSMDDP